MVTYKEAIKQAEEYFNGNELAAKAYVDKYALKTPNGDILEPSPDHLHKRLAKEFARIEKKYSNPLSEEKIYGYFKNFSKIIPQGSPMAGIGNPYQLMSLSNCFVIDSPHDSYGGILLTDQEEAQIMKRRGGVGFDISPIRPKGLKTANAAQTTDGIGGYMERFSNTCREVAQGGRRGALMLTISCHHPEIRTFINIKKNLLKVTGANISIKFTDEFMNAVKNNTEVELRWPVDSKTPSISNFVSAKEIWDEVIDAAWASAEPGILFWDTVTNNTPTDCYKDFKSISTNPCGEIVLSPYDSCRLMLLNVMGFVKNPFSKNSLFDYEEFAKAAKVAQRLMDDLIDLEIECIEKILQKIDNDPEPKNVKFTEYDLWNKILTACKNGRRTGLGLTGVGDLIASLGMTYGDKDSIGFVENLYKTLEINSYESSIELAKERGAFLSFNHENEKNSTFIMKVLTELSEEARKNYHLFGRRNIANTTTPPAGTTSMLACLSEENRLFGTTSGIEPVYLLSYKRRKKINPNDKEAKVDFVDDLGDKWQEFEVFHSGYKLWVDTATKEWKEQTKQTGFMSYFDPKPDSSPYANATSNDVDWKASVDIQAAAQKWICHSISKTCVTNDSLIETENGLKYADELYSSEETLSGEEEKASFRVLTHNENFKNCSTIINQGLKPVFALELKNGLVLKATPDEKVLKLNEETGLPEWIELQNLDSGDRIKLS